MTLLIATDLDGTLVPDGATTVPAYTAGVLSRLDALGATVVFVTGRPLRWLAPLIPHVGRHGMAVVSNGAITYDVHGSRVLHLEGITRADGLALCERILSAIPGARFAIECEDGIRLGADYVEGHPAPGAPRGPLRKIWTDTAVKLLVRNPDVAPDELFERVRAAAGDAATATWSMAGLVELSAAGVTKASALRRLADELGIPSRDVVAFGDMPNDIPMLEWAGRSYAVENAHPTVRRAAQGIAPACADEGVAQVMDRLADALSDPPDGLAPA